MSRSHIDILKILFQGREEILKIIRSNESIVKYLANVKDPICPLIGTDIRLVKRLGEGQSGIVFEIEFPNKGKRKFVVKRVQVDMSMLKIYIPRFGRPKTFMDLQIQYNIPADVIIAYNRETAKSTDVVNKNIIIPLFKRGCSLAKRVKIPRVDGRGVTVFDPHDKICKNTYSEFIISVLVGEFYRNSRSINFLNTFYFASCVTGNDIKNVRQYTFMEKIDKDLKRTIDCILSVYPEVVESIAVQILHAIAMYQETYRIVHGDLHEYNVFLEYVNENTIWNGEKVLDVDHYHYKVRGIDLFILGGKVCPFIVKMGDWGIACKYSIPRVAETNAIHTGYDEGDGPWIPNFYTAAYDPVLVISVLQRFHPTNKFLQNILAWMFKIPKGYTLQDIRDAKKSFFNVETGRPLVDRLDTALSHVSAMAILTNKELMGKYMNGSSGKSILLGEI